MNDKPPLGLPEGSVRAILSLIIILTVCALVVLERTVPDFFAALAGMALSYFFQRAAEVHERERKRR